MEPASFFEGTFTSKRPNLSSGGLRLPYSEDGLYQRDPPRTFSACGAVSPGDVLDGGPSGPKKIVAKSHVNWGHASAQQLRRVSAV